jgi:tetratricopeptide (TPR) repeat protein
MPQVESIAFAAALLFAVHPIHTEAVAWVSGRSELLAACFVFAAWLLHLQNRAVWAAICFMLALLSKESAVVFVPLVLAGDYARGKFKPPLRYAGICGLAVAFVALLWKVQGGRFDKGPYPSLDNALANLPAQWRILNALRVAWKYVALQMYPAALSIDYSYNAIRLYANWQHLLPAALATAAVLGLWMWALWNRRSAWILAGAIYLFGFSVTANVLVPTGTIMGERLAYLPSAGFCLLLALFWVRLESANRKLAAGVLGLLVLAFAARTMARNRDWKDNLTLYSAGVRAVPDSARMHGLLGQEYLKRGELNAAAEELQKAIQIYPTYPQATENYGLAEARLGHDREAREFLEKGLALTRKDDSDYSFRAVTLAAWLVQHGEDDDALKILNGVIADSPGEARAWANRAVIRYRRGEFAGAREDAQTAVRLDAGNGQAQSLLNAMNGAAERKEKQN